MPAVEAAPHEEITKITEQLQQLRTAHSESNPATLILLDRTRPQFPSLAVGCIALDAKISERDGGGGLVIPCLVPPLDFNVIKNPNGYHSLPKLSIPDPAELTVAEDADPQWQSWVVGTREVEDAIWDYLANPDNTWRDQFRPNIDFLIHEAAETYHLV